MQEFSASPISPKSRSWCSTCSAAARRPACRPGPSSRISCPAPSPRTATPSTRCSFPDGPNEAFEFGADAFDLAERLQTPVFVMLDLDIGMNSHLSAPFKWDDARDLRPRQGPLVRGAGKGAEFRPLRRRRRRRDSLSNASRRAIRRAAPISPAAPAATASRAIPRKGCPISTTWSGWSTSSRPRAACCRARFSGGRRSRPGSAFSTTDRLLPPMDEAQQMLAARRHPCRRPAHPRVSARPEVQDFIDDHDQIFVVEQNRDAQMRTLISTDLGVATNRWTPILHYQRDADLRPLHLPRNRRAPAEPARRRNLSRPPNDLSRQAEVSSPLDRGQRTRLHPPRLRRFDVDAVRRLRSRLDHRGDHSRLLRARPAASPHRQTQRHRLLVEDADLHARPEPRLQLGARPHAVGR